MKHPAVAVNDPLAVTTNRLLGENVASTHRAEDRRTLKMLSAAVLLKHDVLANLNRHAAAGAARQFACH